MARFTPPPAGKTLILRAQRFLKVRYNADIKNLRKDLRIPTVWALQRCGALDGEIREALGISYQVYRLDSLDAPEKLRTSESTKELAQMILTYCQKGWYEACPFA